MEPLVSIALATYNGAEFLREQLDSIYAQTHSRLEVIACDDGSSDATVSILKEYKRKKGLRFYENKKRLGFVQNFGKALTYCKGRYIAFADQDDVWLPEKISTLIQSIGNNSLIFSDATLIDEKGSVIAQTLWGKFGIDPGSRLTLSDLLLYNFASGCTMLFKRELCKTALPIPTGASFHDWWFIIQAARSEGVAYIAEPLIQYRQHSLNQTGILQKRGISRINHALDDAQKVFAARTASLKSMRIARKFNTGEEIEFENALACFDDSTPFKKRAAALLKNRNKLFPTRGPVARNAFILYLIFASMLRH